MGYEARAVRRTGVWQEGGWRLKVYEIVAGRGALTPALRESARDHISRELPHPPAADGRYGVGFVGIHQGVDENVVFLDWWARGNELHHRLFRSSGPSGPFQASAEDFTACVWDLGVLALERRAWIDAMLCGSPDVDAYLASGFTGVM